MAHPQTQIWIVTEMDTIVQKNGNSFERQYVNTLKHNNKIETIFNRNNKSKIGVCSTTVANIVAKHLNNTKNSKFKIKR